MSQILLYILIPLLSALIGWLTNKLAILMLFRPRQPVKFGFLTWQGLLPRRHGQLARRSAEILESEILSKDMLREEIGKIDIKPYLEGAARYAIREQLGNKLRLGKIISFVMEEEDLYAMERAIAAGIADQLEPWRDAIAGEVQEHVKIREIVEQRLSELDVSQFETVVHRIAGRELRAIEYWGAAVGFLVGCVQATLFALLG